MQNKNKAFLAGIFFSILFVFFPIIRVSADSSSSTGSSTSPSAIVPCGLNEAYSGGTTDVCTLCHLIIGIKNIIDWIVKIAITVALVGITIAGVMYIISAGSPGMMQTAKSFMTACIIGFALTLAAWLMVYLTMWLISAQTDLGLGSGKKWNEFNCSTTSNASTGSTGGGGGGSGGSGGSASSSGDGGGSGGGGGTGGDGGGTGSSSSSSNYDKTCMLMQMEDSGNDVKKDDCFFKSATSSDKSNCENNTKSSHTDIFQDMSCSEALKYCNEGGYSGTCKRCFDNCSATITTP